MTALRLTPIDPSPLSATQADHSPWIPIDRAAVCLGKTEGAVRVDCQRKWAPRGLARMMRPAGGGREAWHIHASATPALLREHAPSAAERIVHAADALRAATSEQREAARRKARAVALFRTWSRSEGVHVRRDFAAWSKSLASACGLTPSMTRIYEWHARCPESGVIDDLAAALLDQRGGARERDDAQSLSPQAWAAFEALYLREPPLSLSQCWRSVRDVAAREGWTWVSESRARQLVAERLPPRVRDYARLGESLADKIHLTPIGQDPDKWDAGEMWLGDHSRLDFFARVMSGGKWCVRRLWLTAWMDWRTRLLTGWWIDVTPNATTIRAALHHAISPTGQGRSIPRAIWIDNGKDYQSRQLHGKTRAAVKQRAEARAARAALAGDAPELLTAADETRDDWALRVGLFAALGISVHFAAPYNHNGKARIERFFGVVHERWCRLQPSWCGSVPGARDADALAESVSDVMSLPTVDEVRASFDAWATSYNADHERAIEDLEGLSPLEAYTRRLPERRAAQDATIAELRREVDEPRVVTKQGVRLKVAGTTLYFGGGHPALADLVRSRREVWLTYDPADLSSVHVYDDAGRLVCVAQRNTAHGRCDEPVSRAALGTAIAERRAAQRRSLKRVDIGRAMLGDVERAALAARDDQAQRRTRAIAARAAQDEQQPALRLVASVMDQGARDAQAEAALREAIEHDEPREDPHDLAAASLSNAIADLGAASRAVAHVGADPRRSRVSVLDLVEDPACVEDWS